MSRFITCAQLGAVAALLLLAACASTPPHYAAYISNGQPAGFIYGNVYIVDLSTNAYR